MVECHPIGEEEIREILKENGRLSRQISRINRIVKIEENTLVIGSMRIYFPLDQMFVLEELTEALTQEG